jgi:hypothetical protein
MNKGAKISAFLISVGFKAEDAYIEAQRLEGKLGRKVGKAPTTEVKERVVGGGTTIKEDIVTYARSRKGNVFSLASLIGKTGHNSGAISAQITHLVKGGVLSRTGRGEYVLKQYRTSPMN